VKRTLNGGWVFHTVVIGGFGVKFLRIRELFQRFGSGKMSIRR
jgi:hypothetical protein